MSADDSQLPPIVMREKLNPFNWDQMPQIYMDPARDSVQVMGITFSREAMYELFRAFGNDEQRLMNHIAETRARLRSLGHEGNNPNDYIVATGVHGHPGTAFDSIRGLIPSVPGDRHQMFRNMLRPGEQIIVEDLARELRQAYEPFHTGRSMVSWDEMSEDQRVKWIEMAMAAVQYLDRRRAFR